MSAPRFQGSAEWLEWRRGGYGASDAPVLVLGDELEWVGLHGVKLGLTPDPEGTEAMEVGKELEDVIARRYTKQTGEPVIRVDQPLQHPDLPFVRASLDRKRKRGRVPVELKAWGYKSDQFGPDGSDQVPDRMYYQVQQQLAVTGYDQADLAVFFGASKHLSVYQIGRDQGEIDSLLGLEQENWPIVAAGQMPPWPGPAALRPSIRADEIEADQELAALIALHEAAAEVLGQAESGLDEIRSTIRQRLEEAGGARGRLPDGRPFSVTHRYNRDSAVPAWPQIAAGFRARLLELGVPAEDLDFAESALTTTKRGARPLVVRVKKESLVHVAA